MAYKTPNKTCEYLRKILPSEDDGNIKEILKYADEHDVPVLLPETACFLKQLVFLKQPKKILEIGTAIGYSGQIMLNQCDAHLFTIEMSEQSIVVAKDFFTKANLNKRVTIFEGDASEIAPFLDGQFDFIFLDGPKSQYIEYYPHLKRVLAAEGILLCDNVLFNGMTAGEVEVSKKKQSLVKKLDLFLRTVCSDKSLMTSILPVGDGVSLSIKKD